MSEMSKLEVAKDVVDFTRDVVTDKELRKTILGTYSDGSVRSISDAVKGEYLSAKDKKKINKKAKKKAKKEKKKKKNKKKNKYKL